jgi:hypothetical protein
MNFLNKNRIKALQIYQDAFNYLSDIYNQSRNVFTPASPFGQLLTVTANLGEMIFFYIEAAITELNIARAKNVESVYGLARLTGHNATRGISAEGKLGLKLKTDAADNITGNYLSIVNKTRLSCSVNGLEYFFEFYKDEFIIDKTDTTIHYAKIFQGKTEFQIFTGNGQPLQSYSVSTGGAVDNYMVKVTVNGRLYKVTESLYDMNQNEEMCLAKTGISGGLDIYFGNGYFGAIPLEGSSIQIEYVRTAGSAGNIGGSDDITFQFLDEGKDEFGNPVDLTALLDVIIVSPPSFGSNTENPDFTRLIAPKASKSFVLANPDAYVYFLKKYTYFSFVDAFNTKDDEYINDDNIIYLSLLPDITRKLTSDVDYFTLPEEEFTLTESEKLMVNDILDRSGQMLITAENRIIDIAIKRYAISIVLRYFDDADKSEIRSNIRKILNEYFINVKRRDRIPRSDVISLIEEVSGVDSVNVFFISEENEKAVRDGYYIVPVYGYDPITQQRTLIENKKVVLQPGEDPGLGLDEFGDIMIGDRELSIIRGGWYDRNNNYFEVYPDSDKMSSLNVFFKESIKSDLYNKIQQQNMNQIRRKAVMNNTTEVGSTLLNQTTQTKLENPISNIKNGITR